VHGSRRGSARTAEATPGAGAARAPPRPRRGRAGEHAAPGREPRRARSRTGRAGPSRHGEGGAAAAGLCGREAARRGRARAARGRRGRLASVNWLLSGLRRRRTTSPDCPVSQLSTRPTVGRVIRARRVAEPMVRRGHQTVQCAPVSVRCAPDSVRCANGFEPPTVGFAKEGKKSAPDSVRWCTRLSGAPGDRRQELPS
jgi:hypothetical protein